MENHRTTARRTKSVEPLYIKPLALDDFSKAIVAGWSNGELKRAILHDLPRRFHGLQQSRQLEVLSRPPALTGTRWDALLAATVEHIAELHDQPIPGWVNEPERFLKITWVLPEGPVIQEEARAYAPAAFIRHGTTTRKTSKH